MPRFRAGKRRTSVLPGNPPTSVSNGGHKLRRYRVDGVIYARNLAEAEARLIEVVGMQLDDAIIVPPQHGGRRATSSTEGASDA